MSRFLLVVAALLLTNLGGIAAAAENSEHLSKHAREVFVVLNALGMNNSDVHAFVEKMDHHVKDGYLNLAEEDVPGGYLTLRYPIDAVQGDTRRPELSYRLRDTHIELTARTNRIMIGYHLKF